MSDWKTHIKLMGRMWLREPGPDDRNSKDELQFLAGLLDTIDGMGGKIQAFRSEQFIGCEGSNVINPMQYNRPWLNLPDIPDGYMLFGEGPVPDGCRSKCMSAYPELEPEWVEAIGDTEKLAYIIRADLWKKATAPQPSDWERWCRRCTADDYVQMWEHNDWVETMPKFADDRKWRIIKTVTRDRTPDEWRTMARHAGFRYENSNGYIHCLTVSDKGQPHAGIRRLYLEGIEQDIQITETVVIAEYDPSKPEGERIKEAGE